MRQTTDMMVKVRFDTYNTQIVEIRDDYTIGFKFVADIKTLTP